MKENINSEALLLKAEALYHLGLNKKTFILMKPAFKLLFYNYRVTDS